MRIKLTPAGKVTIVAGNGSYRHFTGDGGPAINAGFNGIYAIAIDSANNLYICDSNNNTIRKVTPDGIMKTIAGGRARDLRATTGRRPAALFNLPRHIAAG